MHTQNAEIFVRRRQSRGSDVCRFPNKLSFQICFETATSHAATAAEMNGLVERRDTQRKKCR